MCRCIAKRCRRAGSEDKGGRWHGVYDKRGRLQTIDVYKRQVNGMRHRVKGRYHNRRAAWEITMQQETRAADVRVNRMQLLIDSRNMWLRWHMFPGSTLKRPTNWIRHLKPEPYSQNLISRFWQWEGGAGVADESDDTDESGTASALDQYGELCCGGHYGVSGYASHRCGSDLLSLIHIYTWSKNLHIK